MEQTQAGQDPQNKLREYELTLITRADMADSDTEETLTKYEGVLLRGGGEVLKKDDWGTKRLAYPMNKQYRGRYTFYDLVSTPEDVAEAERLMRIDDAVVRHLTIKTVDTQKLDVEQRKAELAKDAAKQQVRQ